MGVLIPEGVGGCVDTRALVGVLTLVGVLIPEGVGGCVDTRGRGYQRALCVDTRGP